MNNTKGLTKVFLSTRTLWVLVFYLWFLSSQKASGADLQAFVFNKQNGLERSYINAIVRDSDGFFWLGTEKGILRFDGSNFLRITRTEDIFSNAEVQKLFIQDNWLYVIYAERGVCRIRLEDFAVEMVSTTKVISASQGTDGTLYFVNEAYRINQLRGNTILPIPCDSSYRFERVSAYRNNLLAHSWSDKIVVMDKHDGRIKFSLNNPNPGFGVHFFESKDTLGIMTNHQLYFYNGFKPLIPLMVNDSICSGISYFACNQKNEFLISCHRQSIGLIHNGIAEVIPVKDLSRYDIRSLYYEAPSSILIGTNQGLLLVRSPTDGILPFPEPSKPEYIPSLVRRKILPLNADQVLLLGQNYSLDFFQSAGKIEIILKNIPVYDAARAGDNIWLATEGHGIQVYNVKTKKCRKVYQQRPYEAFFSIAYDSLSAQIIAGSRGRIMLFDTSGNVLKKINPGINKAVIKNILIRDGNYLFATEKGLVVADRHFNQLKKYDSKTGNYTDDHINCLFFRKHGSEIWIGHDKGIDMVDPVTFLYEGKVSSNMLPESKVVTMVEDQMGRIWVGTYSGLVCISQDLSQFIRLGTLNGLKNNEYNYKACAILENGNVIFGGINGYDWIQPEKFNLQASGQRGKITGFQIFSDHDTVYLPGGMSDIPRYSFNTDHEMIRIYLGGEDEFQLHNYHFDYRLNDGPWIKLNQASLDLVNISPGTYKVGFRAFSETGNLVSYPELIVKSVIPIYKSIPFVVAISTLCVLMLLLVIRSNYINQKRSRELKESIAMDLHDELGTILLRTLFIIRKNEIGPIKAQLISNIENSLYNLRVFVSTIKSSTKNLSDLLDSIKEDAQSAFSTDSFELLLNIENQEEIQLRSELVRDIRLCVHEIINNILKYASATQVKIDICRRREFLNISIIDNGKAKDLSMLESRSGHGIQNILKRTQRNQGIFHVELNDPSGLKSCLSFPLG